MDRYGETLYQRNVTARYPGGTARLLEWTRKNSLGIEEEMTDENGRPIEETFDVNIEEGTAVLGIPVGFVEPEVGALVTMALDGATNKAYVVLSKDKPEKAGTYARLTVTMRNKQYVDYTTAVHG